jgi:hypothetical protein
MNPLETKVAVRWRKETSSARRGKGTAVKGKGTAVREVRSRKNAIKVLWYAVEGAMKCHPMLANDLEIVCLRAFKREQGRSRGENQMVKNIWETRSRMDVTKERRGGAAEQTKLGSRKARRAKGGRAQR